MIPAYNRFLASQGVTDYVLAAESGGTGSGASAYQEGLVDIWAASRPAKEGELAGIADAGRQIVEFPLLVDVPLFVGQRAGELDFTRESAEALLCGDARPLPGRFVRPGDSSGTWDSLKGLGNKCGPLRQDGYMEIDTAENDKAFIDALKRPDHADIFGFVGYKAFNDNDDGTLTVATFNGVEPAPTRNYEPARLLYFYYDPASPRAVAFIEWIQTPRGQRELRRAGGFPITDEWKQ